MRLFDILYGVISNFEGLKNIEIDGIQIDSRKVGKNDMFIALRGSKTDGTDYIDEAIENGASMIVTDEPIDGVPHVVVKNTRMAYSLIAANFYNNPSRKLKIIAVVGTNGKSTSANAIYEIMLYNGFKVGLIGTGIIKFGDTVIENDMTTPDPMDLHYYFSLMARDNIDYVVMEVSAHAIYLDKMYGIKCELGLFTNFSMDHLDFFGSMDIYKRVKMSFFNSRSVKVGIVNSDDECGREILSNANMPTFTYGLDSPSDVFAIDIEYCIDGTRYVVNMLDEISHFATELVGKYNVYNILGASLVARLLGIPMYGIRDAVKSLKPLAGRYNVVRTDRCDIIIDYAHTPLSLKNVLMETKKLRQKGRLIVVFGCGGDRDKGKRPIMGHIASMLADEVVVTEDNSRSEKREDIISDIMKGVDGGNAVAILDRYDAIKYAYEMANDGDTIIVAGKGAEKYTLNESQKIYYSDREAILDITGC